MWGSIFLNLLSFFIFKSNCLAFVPFPSFEEGEIVKVVDSQYFRKNYLRWKFRIFLLLML